MVGNGNRSMRLGSEKLERNKDTPPCQTVVVRDGPEIVWLLAHVCVRERRRWREIQSGSKSMKVEKREPQSRPQLSYVGTFTQ